MTQTDLFASPDAAPFIRRARIENPKSSHIAAEAIEETAESQCARILMCEDFGFSILARRMKGSAVGGANRSV